MQIELRTYEPRGERERKRTCTLPELAATQSNSQIYLAVW